MLLIFNMILAMISLRDSLCLSAVSLSRQRHDILDFSNYPLSRVLHVTLANWQRFGFEFHLRPSPSAFSKYMDIKVKNDFNCMNYFIYTSHYMDISRPANYFIACYTVHVLTRPNKVETGFHGCNSWLSAWTLSCGGPHYHVVVTLFM